MPRRNQPTARQVRLGTELRRLRERTGITAREAAASLGLDHAKYSHIEAGRAAMSPDRVHTLAKLCGTAGGRQEDGRRLVEALAAMAGERARGWWDTYADRIPRGFLDLAETEHHATALRTIEVAQVPGLLQTEAHARAVFGFVAAGLSDQEIEDRVEYRMRRRCLFERARPLPFEAVVHETALRLRVADRATAREQLAFLLDMSEREGVTIRVIPMDSDGFAAAGYSMLYVRGPVMPLDTVLLDNVHSGVFLDEESQLSRHRLLYSRVREYSLDPRRSRALMLRVAQEM